MDSIKKNSLINKIIIYNIFININILSIIMVREYFHLLPDVYTLEKILNIFSVKEWKHDLQFTIKNDQYIIDEFIKIKPILFNYYRSYKLNKLYENLTILRCITILRHFLEIQNYKLLKNKQIYTFKNIQYLKQKRRVLVEFN